MRSKLKILTVVAILAGAVQLAAQNAQNMTNPISQIKWNVLTGSGDPAAPCQGTTPPPVGSAAPGQLYFDQAPPNAVSTCLQVGSAYKWVKNPVLPQFGTGAPSSAACTASTHGAFYVNTSQTPTPSYFICNGAVPAWTGPFGATGPTGSGQPSAPMGATQVFNAPAEFLGVSPINCTPYPTNAACLAAALAVGGGASIVIPPGSTGGLAPQAYNMTATALCSLDPTTGALVIYPVAQGSGYTSPPTVTVSTGNLAAAGSVTATLTGDKVTGYTIVGNNTGYNSLPILFGNSSCPAQIAVSKPPASAPTMPVLNLSLGSTSYNTYVRVDDFGCAGDGTTDDTQCIQAAINYAANLPTLPEVHFTGGKRYCVGCNSDTTTGQYQGGGFTGAVPIAATLSVTTNGSGAASGCSVVDGGTGLITSNFTSPSGGSGGLGVTLNSTSHTITACTGSGGVGYPASSTITVYSGPVCTKLGGYLCQTLPPTWAFIRYSITVPPFVTLEGDGATIVGGFTNTAAWATTYVDGWPYSAIFAGQSVYPNGGKSATATHVTVHDLSIVSAWIGFGNMGSYWNIHHVGFGGGWLAQGQNAQYMFVDDVNFISQIGSMGVIYAGGQQVIRAFQTAVDAANSANGFDLVDDGSFTNINHYGFGSTSVAQFNQMRKNADCWMDIHFFRAEDMGTTNNDQCYTNSVQIVPDQDLATMGAYPDAQWRGALGIAVNVMSRYPRPLNGVVIENLVLKQTSNYGVNLGTALNGGHIYTVGVESPGCYNSVFGSPTCPNPFEPYTTPPSMILAPMGTGGRLFQISGGSSRPWQSLFASGQLGFAESKSSYPQVSSTSNPLLDFNALLPPALNATAIGFNQGGVSGALLSGDSQPAVFQWTDAPTSRTGQWELRAMHSRVAPSLPTYMEWIFNTSSGAGGNGGATFIKDPGLIVKKAQIGGGNITSFTITNAGLGYPPFNYVPCTVAPSTQKLANGTTFYQSTCAAYAGPLGTITTLLCAPNCGVGYLSSSPPAVTLAAPPSGITATATAVVNNIDAFSPIQDHYICSFFLPSGGTIPPNTTQPITAINCPGVSFSITSSRADFLRLIANGGTPSQLQGIISELVPTATDTLTLYLRNPTSSTITYVAGTSASPWQVEVLSGNVTASATVAAVSGVIGTQTTYIQNVAFASGTAVLGTAAIASGACAAVVTVAATGVATTDVITEGYPSDPTAIVGYGVSATGAVLRVYPYPTANNVNFKVCNSTAASITPGALTMNWRVAR